MSELKPKQEKFMIALMQTSTVEQAAAVSKITTATAFKYMRDPFFKKAYQEYRRKAMEQVTASLQQAASEAVETLRKVMASEDSTPSARVQAARAILDNAYKATEIDEVIARLDELEEVAERGNKFQV